MTSFAEQSAAEPADQFVAHQPMLHGLAYRLLGSWHDAEDVVQEAYVRWSGVDQAGVSEPRRYLTRVVARLAVDHLRRRRVLREGYVGEWLPEPVATDPSPFSTVDTSDLSLAVLHLMERLTPPQRAVYVLRTAFELPYDEIAAIVDRTPEDCRQLHRRAAQTLEVDRPRFAPSRDEHRRLLTDFVAAARDGDLPRLESMLRADVIAWTDGGGRVRAARRPIAGRARVAYFFARIYRRGGTFKVVHLDLNGAPALVVETSRSVHALLVEADGHEIVGVYVVANPDKLAAAQ
ncbi:ECF subfamily RNA polymerase sigma-24 subunit [Candidatus Protofrankia californiensis]|uniref:ECF subfamily RNA polymerase sigma-24 subunit n=1 Tax=Candidatus Protofrankia californiensis TaxID=1839754 RepID=A0A1C3PH48_9ACTN|nr:ECF subfamily RNA polymerase sigma-24 subunit [Candidatus Protofrankia californiensis]